MLWKKKQINKPAWTILSVLQRTLDCALQEIQFTHISSASLMSKVASELATYLSTKKDSEKTK